MRPPWRHTEGSDGKTDGPERNTGVRRLRGHALVVVTASVLALATAALANALPGPPTPGTQAEAVDLAAGQTSPLASTGVSESDRAPAESASPPATAPQSQSQTMPPASSLPSTVLAPEPEPEPDPGTAPGSLPPLDNAITQVVTQTDQLAAEFPSMALGLAVVDLSTGQLAEGTLGAQPFYAASLTKLILAIDIMQRREVLGLPVAAADRALLAAALGPSDDDAMNALWVLYDGPGAVQRVTQNLGLTETALAPDSSQWGEVTVSARDMARLCHYMMSELSPSDREFLVDAMQAAPESAADGFDQAFGLLSPLLRAGHETEATGPIAKQGWMELIGGVLSLNSVGVVGGGSGYVVALLSRQAVGGDWDLARQQLTVVSDSLAAALS